MAEARPSNLKSVGKSSDVLPDIYCNPCYEHDGDIFEVAGFCQICFDFLCAACFAAHNKGTLTKNHQVLDKSKMPRVKPKVKPQSYNEENCFNHQNEYIQSFCKTCDQLLCKICRSVDHHACKVEKLSIVAINVRRSQELKDLNHKLDMLKKGYDDNISKAKKHVGDIEKYYTDAISAMKKIQTEVARLLAETEKQAEKVRVEDIQRMEDFLSTCEMLGEQIKTIKSNLDKKKDRGSNEDVFVSMKRAESQLKSFKTRLEKFNTDNTVCQYKFEPDTKIQALFREIEVLGKLSFSNAATSSGRKLDTPLHVGDIDTQTTDIRGLVLISNLRILLAENGKTSMVKLIGIKQNKLIDELQLPGRPFDIAKIKNDEFALTCFSAKKIYVLNVTPKSISKKSEMSVSGKCYGIDFNEKDRSLIVAMRNPGKVEILSLTGTVIRSIEKDENGARLFTLPFYLAMSRSKTMMYVSDEGYNSVTLINLSGKVKAVYKDDGLNCPGGICVNKAGIVYVVGFVSNTVHKLVPGSNTLEPLLDKKNELDRPIAIAYCDVEDKIYVGQDTNNFLKVFQITMK